MRTIRKPIYNIAVLAVCGLLAASCTQRDTPTAAQQPTPIGQAILHDTTSAYYIDFDNYNAADPALAIGVFDSGTGGLTVLDALVRFDDYDNRAREAGGDGTPDFTTERFIYLADQANMPYGNYHAENKTDLLVEHIVKDAQFLLGERYYPDAASAQPTGRKQGVKVIVIACNTATAYGKESIEAFIAQTGQNIPVIGVIDAGSRGALDVFAKDESGSIGVFATVGTIASHGYEKALRRIKDERGYTGNIQIYNQGGHGVAEAVDEVPDFIDHTANAPRTNYRGPAFDNSNFKIQRALLDIYNFNTEAGNLLCDAQSPEDCNVLQLNSAENYVRYHLVSLMEQLRNTPDAQPLKALLLGCTHYPYLTSEIRDVLRELHDYKEDGQYRYRHLMHEDIHLIDPAENVAHELHTFLRDHNLFNPSGSMEQSEFYISVPNTDNPAVIVDEQGRFTYDYKYGRNAGEIQEYVKVVPFSSDNIPAEIVERLELTIPETFKLIDTLQPAPTQ